MSWVRYDDGFTDHPKVVGLSDRAFRLHHGSLEYCARHLTDGDITAAEKSLLARFEATSEHAGELLAASLWERAGGRLLVHDYLVYQPSRAKVLADRAAAAERQTKSRAGRSSRRESHRDEGVTHDASNGVTSHAPAQPSPAQPDPHPAPDPDPSQAEPGHAENGHNGHLVRLYAEMFGVEETLGLARRLSKLQNSYPSWPVEQGLEDARRHAAQNPMTYVERAWRQASQESRVPSGVTPVSHRDEPRTAREQLLARMREEVPA